MSETSASRNISATVVPLYPFSRNSLTQAVSIRFFAGRLALVIAMPSAPLLFHVNLCRFMSFKSRRFILQYFSPQCKTFYALSLHKLCIMPYFCKQKIPVFARETGIFSLLSVLIPFRAEPVRTALGAYRAGASAAADHANFVQVLKKSQF